MGILNTLSARYRNGGVVRAGLSPQASMTSMTSKESRCRIEVIEAVNGRVLEVNTRNTDHEDWDCTIYIVRDDETLADAIATLLVLKGGA